MTTRGDVQRVAWEQRTCATEGCKETFIAAKRTSQKRQYCDTCLDVIKRKLQAAQRKARIARKQAEARSEARRA